MTAAEQPARRRGSYDEIAGMRIYYRLDGETDERWIDWRSDRGPTIAEAMAVKQATVSDVNPPRLQAVLASSAGAENDPEALQALIWMVRRFRQGEPDLKITDLASVNVWSVRQDYFDAQQVFLDFAEEDPTDEQRALALKVAAALQELLPSMSDAAAHAGALGLVAAWPDDPAGGDGPGEDQAGDGAPAAQPATTRTTSKRTSAGGSRNSRTRTGSGGKTSSATPRGRG